MKGSLGRTFQTGAPVGMYANKEIIGLERKYIGGLYIRRWSFHSTHSTGYSQSVSMKTFSLSEDRVVVVKSRNGSQYVVIKQKDSDIKYMEFTPNR